MRDRLLGKKKTKTLVKKLNREKRMRKIVLIGLSAILLSFLLFFIIASIREFTGSFTINLNYKETEGGFSLYDNAAFNNPTTRLSPDPLKKAMTNITLPDLDLGGIDASIGGSRHGSVNPSESAYLAYTFFIKNNLPEAHAYETRINLVDAAKGVEEAVRLIIIKDKLTYYSPGNERISTVYGKQNKSDGCLDVFCDESFLDVRRGTVIHFDSELKPGEVHKYTIVMYLEGEDPECVDDIKGGMIKFNMEFLVL